MITIETIGKAWVIICICILVFYTLKYFFFPNNDNEK